MVERSANLPAASSCVNTQRKPRRFSFFSSKRGSTVDAADIGDLVSPGESFHSLFDTGPTKGIWWLDILNPTEGEINALAKAFSIHPLTSEDIKTGEIHEKVEVFKHYYFVCFRSFNRMGKAGKYHVEPLNVYILVFREGTLSIAFRPSPHAANVQNRIRMLRNYIALSSDWICYALIDDIVDSFSPLISEIEQETNAMEDSVFVTRVHELSSVLLQVHVCRKKTMSTIHLLRSKGFVIKSLARHCDGISLFLGDVQDHLVTMKSKLDHYEGILSRSHSDYLTRLSVDRTRTGNQTVKFIVKITVIAAILVLLNVVCGLFGMNVRVPGGDSDGLKWWFGILGAIILIISASLAIARRMKLI
ncbi:Mg2+ transporter protein [Periconia macrospinosa]|uniref:Mg2+ transporter protein n=1 Tax=Periconia macrospinosa TaxID=97972 RepID=A0A2V1D4N1_9PLEO|nr:Mg2+ transporter protein [Periconia macrospinosa]